jgi:hypothetical protein
MMADSEWLIAAVRPLVSAVTSREDPMSTELMDWVHAYLERDEDVVAPIKKMWNEWHADHAEPSLQDFTAIVLADERFEEMGGVDHAEGMDWMSEEEMEEYARDMEANGFFSGPRVKLKSRPLTLEHITRMIKKHNDRMEWALQQARESMPEDVSEQGEGALIDIQVMARQLRRQLREAGLETNDD